MCLPNDTENNMATPLTHFLTTDFNYHKNSKVFSAEISTLKGNRPVAWSAACGLGALVIESHVTGNSRVFNFLMAKRDRDHDITCWVYEGIDGITVVLWND